MITKTWGCFFGFLWVRACTEKKGRLRGGVFTSSLDFSSISCVDRKPNPCLKRNAASSTFLSWTDDKEFKVDLLLGSVDRSFSAMLDDHCIGNSCCEMMRCSLELLPFRCIVINYHRQRHLEN